MISWTGTGGSDRAKGYVHDAGYELTVRIKLVGPDGKEDRGPAKSGDRAEMREALEDLIEELASDQELGHPKFRMETVPLRYPGSISLE